MEPKIPLFLGEDGRTSINRMGEHHRSREKHLIQHPIQGSIHASTTHGYRCGSHSTIAMENREELKGEDGAKSPPGKVPFFGGWDDLFLRPRMEKVTSMRGAFLRHCMRAESLLIFCIVQNLHMYASKGEYCGEAALGKKWKISGRRRTWGEDGRGAAAKGKRITDGWVTETGTGGTHEEEPHPKEMHRSHWVGRISIGTLSLSTK